MAQTVADVLVGALELVGVKQIFGLIGDSTERACRRTRRSQIEWIGVCGRPGQADRLPSDQAGSVVIMCGAGCHGAVGELRALGSAQAPLIHSLRAKDIMPDDDPRWMGGIGMIGTKTAYYAVMHCDLLLMVGTDYPYSNFLPRRGAGIRIDERAVALGRRAPDHVWCRRLGATDPEAAARPGRAQERYQLLGEGDQSAASGMRCWTSKPIRRAARIASIRRLWPAGKRSCQARRGIHPRRRSEHALVRQLDPPKRIAADHRFVQQRCRRNGAWSGQRCPSAGPEVGPAYRVIPVWWSSCATRGGSQVQREWFGRRAVKSAGTSVPALAAPVSPAQSRDGAGVAPSGFQRASLVVVPLRPLQRGVPEDRHDQPQLIRHVDRDCCRHGVAKKMGVQRQAKCHLGAVPHLMGHGRVAQGFSVL